MIRSKRDLPKGPMKAARLVVTLVAALVTGTAGSIAVAGAAQADDLPTGSVAIDAGGVGGSSFLPDSYYSAGNTASNNSGSAGNPNWPGGVAHPIPQAQWDTYRYLETSYAVPNLTPGASYELRLYFVEWYWTKQGQRIFDVAANGTVVLKNFDPIKAVVDRGGDGRLLGIEKDFTVVADAAGTVQVDFIRGPADQPEVNAIVLVPTP